MARPRKDFNWDEFDKLCGIHATRREIAGWFEMSEDTVDRRCQEEFGMNFAAYVEERQSPGKISLRRKQYELAMNGNVTMLIWLGKQYLGQKDKQEVFSTSPQKMTDDELISEARRIIESASNA